MDIHGFKERPIMGILRGIDEEMIDPIVDIAQSAGLQTIEVTMNTPDAPKLIARLVSSAQNRLTIGAGTVLTQDDLKAALKAGATYIVLPTLVHDVVDPCVKYNVPVFPGALTPNEIQNAWNAGAAMVKVFPASYFGPKYFKEIKGPFQDTELLACGGVTSENLDSFFEQGAAAVSIGGSIFKKELLQTGQFDRIEASLKAFVDRYTAWKENKV